MPLCTPYTPCYPVAAACASIRSGRQHAWLLCALYRRPSACTPGRLLKDTSLTAVHAEGLRDRAHSSKAGGPQAQSAQQASSKEMHLPAVRPV